MSEAEVAVTMTVTVTNRPYLTRQGMEVLESRLGWCPPEIAELVRRSLWDFPFRPESVARGGAWCGYEQR